MADVNELLKSLGITPRDPAVRHTSTAKEVRALSNGRGTQPKNVSPVKQNTRVRGTQPKRVSPIPVVHTLIDQAKDDSAWSMIGNVFGKALEVVDTPRAWVGSAVKEASDWLTYDSGLGDLIAKIPGVDTSDWKDPDRVQHGSWSELVSQANRHMGFQETLDKNTSLDGGWQRSALGFAGDVATDPFSYATGLGAKGGSEGVTAAVKAGGRKEVSEAVTQAIAKEFPKETFYQAGKDGIEQIVRDTAPEGADRLIADSARKGRGALTKKGLAAAGVTTEEAGKLGIPKLGYEAFGVPIPGGNLAAESIANMKGALKEWVGGTRASKALRSLRITDKSGVLRLTNIIRAAEGDPVMQAKAVKVLMSVTEGKAISRKFGAVEVEALRKSELGKLLKDTKSTLIRDSEDPAQKTLLNDWLNEMHQKITKMGVDVPYRENYVPHLVTSDARKLGRTSTEVKAVIDSLDKSEGFQLGRVGEGTIAEENARFAAKHGGTKLFEDDGAVIATRYLAEAEHAVNRARINQGLAELGVAEEIPVETIARAKSKQLVEQRHVDAGIATPDQLGQTFDKSIKQASKALTATEKAEAKATKQGVTLQEKRAAAAGAALNEQKAQTLGRVTEIDTQIKDLAARHQGATDAVALLDGKAKALTKKRDGWYAIAKREVGRKRQDALNTAKRISRELDHVNQDLETAQNGLDSLVGRGGMQGKMGFAEDVASLSAEREDLQAVLASTQAKGDALKITATTAEDAQSLSLAHVEEANTKLQEIAAKRGAAQTNADIVSNVYDAVLGDAEHLMPIVDEQLARLDSALSAIPGKKVLKKTKNLAEYGADISNNLRLAKEVLAGVDTPAAQLMAKFEAAASVADAKALELHSTVDALQESIKAMNDPKFRLYLRQNVTDGMQRINETLQIPEWADQALTATKVFNDDKMWTGWTKGYDKSLNVLKGYMVARPGFVIRNAYSSLFNVYLEGGARALKAVGEYEEFYRILKKNPDDYLVKATERWGAKKADMLDRAFAAQTATGFGQAADEFHVGTFSHLSKNPLNPNFAPIRGIRKANEVVEDIVRGGHAYDVLKRGGSDSLAVDTLEKWHFNYHDTTSFDRGMKRVMPFWAFFSNNVALQAQTFPQILPKLNRTYFNAQRNLSYGETSDTDVPGYFKDALPIRLPGGGGPGTNVKYLFPDLPALQGVRDLQAAVDSKGLSLVAQTNPLMKVGFDAVLGDKNSYTGQPFLDKYRKTPIPLPGWLPGVDEGGNSGDSVWTDRTQYAYENALPTLSQADRFGGTSNRADTALSFLGIGIRTNNDKTRKGEQLRRARAQQTELDRVRQLGKV